MVSRNVVVTQIRSDPGSIPGISTQLFVLFERTSSSFRVAGVGRSFKMPLFLLPSPISCVVVEKVLP